MKVPTPEPSIVFVESATVGLGEALQQTPRAVTGRLPLKVTLPPLIEDEFIIPLAFVVVTVGSEICKVVKTSSAPYAVPTLLVA